MTKCLPAVSITVDGEAVELKGRAAEVIQHLIRRKDLPLEDRPADMMIWLLRHGHMVTVSESGRIEFSYGGPKLEVTPMPVIKVI